MSPRAVFRTTYTVEVFAEVGIPESATLKDFLDWQAVNLCHVRLKPQAEERLDAATAAKLLTEADLDPGIFGLASNGDELDEEQDLVTDLRA